VPDHPILKNYQSSVAYADAATLAKFGTRAPYMPCTPELAYWRAQIDAFYAQGD